MTEKLVKYKNMFFYTMIYTILKLIRIDQKENYIYIDIYIYICKVLSQKSKCSLVYTVPMKATSLYLHKPCTAKYYSIRQTT